ncbi:carbohydrate kinase family protein [Pseudolysinimonas sp.]|uniref:carbohydrate kinase family protein n=1 Tax=Pseudolysinimonas sp. TaxID=2680009 RepID=UPI003F7CE640
MSGSAPGERIVCFGDLANDVVVAPRGEIRADTDTSSHIRHTPGGSAANTAAWLGVLGAPVDLVACAGRLDVANHVEWLRGQGVVPHLHVATGLETSTIVIVVEGDRRTMLTDRGANRALGDDQVTDALLDAAGYLHLTGYNLIDGPRAAGMARLIARAHDRGILVSMNPGSAGYIADYGADAFVAETAEVDLMVANADEATLLAGTSDAPAAARLLADRHGMAVVTQGPRSVLVAARDAAPHEVSVPAARMVDPTGAGDAMAAGFLNSWRSQRDLVRAAEAGILVAAQAIQMYGGRPPF